MRLSAKQNYAFLFILFIAACVFILQKLDFSSWIGEPKTTTEFTAATTNTPRVTMPIAANNNSKPNATHDLPTKTNSSYADNYVWPTVGGSPANMEEFKQWSYSRGHTYWFEGKTDEYSAYDLETLKKLANSGDIHAMEALSRYPGISGKSKIMLLNRAAVYGSTSALQSIAIGLDSEYSPTDDNFDEKLTPEERHTNQLEAMAYYELAGLRGDKGVKLGGLKYYASYKKIEFTAEEKQQIKVRGRELYNELQQQRTNLGLGDFDNTVPASVTKLVELDNSPESVRLCALPLNKGKSICNNVHYFEDL
jgi:hypothetical protein